MRWVHVGSRTLAEIRRVPTAFAGAGGNPPRLPHRRLSIGGGYHCSLMPAPLVIGHLSRSASIRPRRQSVLMLAALMIGHHLSISAL